MFRDSQRKLSHSGFGLICLWAFKTLSFHVRRRTDSEPHRDRSQMQPSGSLCIVYGHVWLRTRVGVGQWQCHVLLYQQGLISPATNLRFQKERPLRANLQIGVQMDESVALSPFSSTTTISPTTLYKRYTFPFCPLLTAFIPAMMTPEFSAVSPHRGLGNRGQSDFNVPQILEENVVFDPNQNTDDIGVCCL